MRSGRLGRVHPNARAVWLVSAARLIAGKVNQPTVPAGTDVVEVRVAPLIDTLDGPWIPATASLETGAGPHPGGVWTPGVQTRQGTRLAQANGDGDRRAEPSDPRPDGSHGVLGGEVGGRPSVGRRVARWRRPLVGQ